MTVKELKKKLDGFPDDLSVYIPGEGCETGGGTWLPGEPVEVETVAEETYWRNRGKRYLVLGP